MINCKIAFLLLSIFPFLKSDGMSYEETRQILCLTSNNEVSEIRCGVSHAVPVDLSEVENKSLPLPLHAIGRQGIEISVSCRKSKYKAVNLVGFKAVTDDYGQLKSEESK